jgi:D-alanyl-D-alanine carboxypeptidase
MMKRRVFLKIVAVFLAGGKFAPEVLAGIIKAPFPPMPENRDDYIRDYLVKMRHFNDHNEEDVYVGRGKDHLLESSVKRFIRLQQTVGHGNFHLLNFDDAVNIARNYTRVGRFSEAEIDFLEMIFYEDSGLYGFLGDKPVKKLTDRVLKQKVVKVSNTGNYVYKGLPLETYQKIKRTLGDVVILTSGVRSVIKQFSLFLNKAYENYGNLSLASRSLAPPGYSYHGIGDFDVGQKSFGAANFTDQFITTEVYQRLTDLGYLTLRYPKDNLLGVRFEPWHIRVKS